MFRFAAAAVVAVAVGAGLAFAPDRDQLSAFPNLEVTAIDGRTYAAEKLRGKVVLVSFWATSCAVCMQEMPQLVALYRERRHDGFELISIAMPYDPPSRVVDTAKRFDLPFPVVLDPAAELVAAFGDVQVTPSLFLFDRNARVVDAGAGADVLRRLADTTRDMLEGDLVSGPHASPDRLDVARARDRKRKRGTVQLVRNAD